MSINSCTRAGTRIVGSSGGGGGGSGELRLQNFRSSDLERNQSIIREEDLD